MQECVPVCLLGVSYGVMNEKCIVCENTERTTETEFQHTFQPEKTHKYVSKYN